MSCSTPDSGPITGFALRRIALLAAVVAIACGPPDRPESTTSARTCGVTDTPILGNEGIGAFRLGAPVDSVQAACVVLQDTSMAQGAEGMPERRLTVLVAGDTVEATIEDAAVWRIEVRTPHIRTQDSIGVGSTMATLRRQPMEFLGYGEGGPFVRVTAYCGLSLELTGVPGFARRLDDLPPSASVERILVVGCRSP